LLLAGAAPLLLLAAHRRQRLLTQPQLGGRQRLEEGPDDVVIDGVGGQALADRDLVLLAQEVADVTGPVLVLDHHLVPALPAPDQAVQQGLPRPRHAARLVPVVLAVVVADHGLDLLEGRPVNIGRVAVTQADLPLRHG
jgi:hypothetical protein